MASRNPSPPVSLRLKMPEAPRYRSNEVSWLDMSPASPPLSRPSTASSSSTLNPLFRSEDLVFQPMPAVHSGYGSLDTCRILHSSHSNSDDKSWQPKTGEKKRPSTSYSIWPIASAQHDKWTRPSSHQSVRSDDSRDSVEKEKQYVVVEAFKKADRKKRSWRKMLGIARKGLGYQRFDIA